MKILFASRSEKMMDRSALGFAFNSVMDFSLFTFLKVLLFMIIICLPILSFMIYHDMLVFSTNVSQPPQESYYTILRLKAPGIPT